MAERANVDNCVILTARDLPPDARVPGAARDRFVISLAGATRAAILSATMRPRHDVECVLGYMTDGEPAIDWSSDCTRIAIAVAACAIDDGFIHHERLPRDGTFPVRIWQPHVHRTVIVHVPFAGGKMRVTGDVQLEIIDPADGNPALFPTGDVADTLAIPGFGMLNVTVLDVGAPTVFVDATHLGVSGAALERLVDTIRNACKAAFGPAGERVVLVSAPRAYVTHAGLPIAAKDIDVRVWDVIPETRHAVPAVVAIGVAAVIPGSVVHRAAAGRPQAAVRVGSPQRVESVTAAARRICGKWIVTRASLGPASANHHA
jgi:2-methylaconitate cis-trans-isomerase PrpF